MSNTRDRLKMRMKSQAQRMRTARTLRGTQRTIATRRAGRVMSVPRAPPASFFPMGSEIKAIDIPSGNYVFRTPATNTTILLNGVQTGAGFFNRVGSRIEMKNLHIRGFIRYTATAVQAVIRLLIIYDRQPVGALPVITDFLQARDQAGAATTAGDSEINLDNRDRFTIVRDLQLYAPSVTYTAGVLTNGPNYPGVDQQIDINEFIKLKEMGTHFKSSSNPATIADISTGALYAAFVTFTADNTIEFSGGFRLRYFDN